MICRECLQDKDLAQFYKNKTYTSGYNSLCKTCHKAYQESYRATPEFKEAHNRRSKDWVKANGEKRKEITARYREANREKGLRYSREWAKQNRDLKNANWQRYKARKKQATPENTEAIDFVYYAAKVLKDVTGKQWDVDHIVPLCHDKVCGLHTAKNLQLLTPSDNYRKGNSFG
jgi:HD superfamily phosphohydrolase